MQLDAPGATADDPEGDAFDAPASVSARLHGAIRAAIDAQGGWLPFDRFMEMALYLPGLGYYANGSIKFGALPASGSDFVTAPELSPAFGSALARQVGEALRASDTDEIWEFGAGSGALAAQLLAALDAPDAPDVLDVLDVLDVPATLDVLDAPKALDAPDALDALGPGGHADASHPPIVRRYNIVDLSGTLRQRQQERLAAHGDRVRWLDRLPAAISGVVVGNEVLDAMPVTLLHFDGEHWQERGVAAVGGRFAWADRPTALRPSVDDKALAAFLPGSVTEIQPQREAFIATLAERLTRGAAFFVDYGFPAAEFYHPERIGGTLMCHRAHRVDDDPLVDIGLKDITTHVDFTGIALAGQSAGLEVLGYTSQARFLMNCGLLELLQGADLPARANAQKLLTEHEMGELFKVIGFAKGCDPAFVADPIGFRHGDRTHTL